MPEQLRKPYYPGLERAVSKPRYYGFQNGQHYYVVKLKRKYYPPANARKAHIWTGTTLRSTSREDALQQAREAYQRLSDAVISDVTSFEAACNRYRYFVDFVD